MKWFGRKSVGRADARPVLMRSWSNWTASERPWAYEDGVRAGYFEILADKHAVNAGAILGGDNGPEFTGFAVTGDRLGDVARGIGQLAPFVVDGNMVRFEPGPVHALGSVARVEGQGVVSTRLAESALPHRLSIGYADSGRDYQAGRQSARRLAGGLSDDVIALPAVLDAGGAKLLSETVLARVWRERLQCEVSADWRALTVRPGDLVTLPGDATVWRVTASTIEAMRVRLSLVAHGVANSTATTADGGRAVGEADQMAGTTQLVVIDLPPLGPVADTPQVAILANGTGTGWRRAALQVSNDGGTSWEWIGATALPATIGIATTSLAAGPTRVVDHIHHVDVTLAHAGLLLNDADDDALAAGANMAMLGTEALQFGRAIPLGGASWRLSELWRGRCGTELSVEGHAIGEAFALLDVGSIRFLSTQDAMAGASVSIQGVGDTTPIEAIVTTANRALRPLSPVAVRLADDGARIVWTRRSRDGFVWRDGVDAPLVEEREAYWIEAISDGWAVAVEVPGPEWLLPTEIAVPGAVIAVAVRQLGGSGLSDPASATFTI